MPAMFRGNTIRVQLNEFCRRLDNTEIGDFVATAVNWDEEPYCVELADTALPPFGETCPT